MAVKKPSVPKGAEVNMNKAPKRAVPTHFRAKAGAPRNKNASKLPGRSV